MKVRVMWQQERELAGPAYGETRTPVASSAPPHRPRLSQPCLSHYTHSEG